MKVKLLSICFLILSISSLKAQNFDCDFSDDFESPIPKCFFFLRDTSEVEYTIYPNPTDGEIQIDSPIPVHIEVFNMNSKLLKSDTARMMSLYELQQGIYYIRINQKQIHKVVKI